MLDFISLKNVLVLIKYYSKFYKLYDNKILKLYHRFPFLKKKLKQIFTQIYIEKKNKKVFSFALKKVSSHHSHIHFCYNKYTVQYAMTIL